MTNINAFTVSITHPSSLSFSAAEVETRAMKPVYNVNIKAT